MTHRFEVHSGSISAALSDVPHPAAEAVRDCDPMINGAAAEQPESPSAAQSADVRSGVPTESGVNGAPKTADSRNMDLSEAAPDGSLATDAPRLVSNDFIPDASDVGTAPGDADGASLGVSVTATGQPESRANFVDDNGGSLPASPGGTVQLGLEQPTVHASDGARTRVLYSGSGKIARL